MRLLLDSETFGSRSRRGEVLRRAPSLDDQPLIRETGGDATKYFIVIPNMFCNGLSLLGEDHEVQACRPPRLSIIFDQLMARIST